MPESSGNLPPKFIDRAVSRVNGQYLTKAKRKRKRRKRFKHNRTIVSSRGERAQEVYKEHGYYAYLRTGYWIKLRRRLCQTGDMCMGCRHIAQQKELQLHHLRYDSLGREGPDDLVRLCRTCHERLHVCLSDEFPGTTTEFKARQSHLIWPKLFDWSLNQARAHAGWHKFWETTRSKKNTETKRKRRDDYWQSLGDRHSNWVAQQNAPLTPTPPITSKKPSFITTAKLIQPCRRCKIRWALIGDRLCPECLARASEPRHPSRERPRRKHRQHGNDRPTTL